MKKTLYLYALTSMIFLLTVSLVASPQLFEHETAVNIKTEPNVNLVIRFEDTYIGEIFRSIPATTDSNGNARIKLETDRDEVNAIILFIENASLFIQEDNIIKTEVAGPFDTAKIININLYEIIASRLANETNVSEESENQTIIPENLTSETEEGEETEITGSAIKGILSNKTTYYILGIIVLVLLGGFVALKVMKKKFFKGKIFKGKEIKTKKLSDVRDEKKGRIQDQKGIIEDAEKKIREAQEDIKKIKNEDAIKEAKKKLVEDQKRLMRLRDGKE